MGLTLASLAAAASIAGKSLLDNAHNYLATALSYRASGASNWSQNKWARNNFMLAQYESLRDQQNADRNMAFQREQFAYQQRENDIARQREDTMYQRSVADMQKAGINPLVGVGGSAGAFSSTSFSGPSSGSVSSSASVNPSEPDYSQLGRIQLAQQASSLLNDQTYRKDVVDAGKRADAQHEFEVTKHNDNLQLERDKLAASNATTDAQLAEQRLTGEAQRKLLAAQALKVLTDNKDAEYEYKYKKDRGISSLSSEKYILGKEIMQDVVNSSSGKEGSVGAQWTQLRENASSNAKSQEKREAEAKGGEGAMTFEEFCKINQISNPNSVRARASYQNYLDNRKKSHK